MKNKILVIGGAGFLGSHVSDSLTENGYKVTIMDCIESQWLRDSQEFILGDIVICSNIVNKESKIYKIHKENRWAHMVIHSMLHLQGYSHDNNKCQKTMESKEKELMNYLGFTNPYYAS